MILSVTDGLRETETILDIRPSPPYIELTNNSHLVVSQGGNSTLTTSNLYSDTNLDVDNNLIRYFLFLNWVLSLILVIYLFYFCKVHSDIRSKSRSADHIPSRQQHCFHSR